MKNFVLKLFFRMLYSNFAWAYDLVSSTVSLGLWKSWVLTTVDFIKGDVILEIGPGPGHLQLALQKLGFSTYAVDKSPQMVRITRNRMKSASYEHRITLGSAQHLPFSVNTFDTVVTTFPTKEIIDQASINESWCTLKPGGRIVIVPSAWVTGQKPIRRAVQWLFKITGQADQLIETTCDRLKGPLSASGFVVHVVVKEIKNSTLLIVIGEKPDISKT